MILESSVQLRCLQYIFNDLYMSECTLNYESTHSLTPLLITLSLLSYIHGSAWQLLRYYYNFVVV